MEGSKKGSLAFRHNGQSGEGLQKRKEKKGAAVQPAIVIRSDGEGGSPGNWPHNLNKINTRKEG